MARQGFFLKFVVLLIARGAIEDPDFRKRIALAKAGGSNGDQKPDFDDIFPH